MSEYLVQKCHFNSTAAYVCWPKFVRENRTWDGRDHSGWTIDAGGSQTVDLISDAGFAEGDVILPWVDVAAGNDADARQYFVVKSNGSTAKFTAGGTAFTSSLTYNSTS